MNLFRSLLAVLFAIVIANPACCCTVPKAEEPAETSHCCGGPKKETKQPEPCMCLAKQPRQVEDPPVTPAFNAVELPPVLESSEALRLPAVPVREEASVDFRHDTGPPRLLLALLQRFLI